MLFVQGLRTMPAATVGTLSLAEPLVAVLAGIGLLHEHLAAPVVIGCGLLAAGLAFASLRPAPPLSRVRLRSPRPAPTDTRRVIARPAAPEQHQRPVRPRELIGHAQAETPGPGDLAGQGDRRHVDKN